MAGQSPATRIVMYRALIVLVGGLTLVGCAHSAASLGLTGASQAAPPPAPSDADIGVPGIQTGHGYGPSLVPSTGGNGRYYGSP